jgi:nitroimidazol reductase NimA-like FMN-containing flavoprotein (pyridoxamine 5'-phosphate oxidase superfamily)/GNAT superfamily N-acetyltransferase
MAAPTSPGPELPVTPRTTLKRHADRGSHDLGTLRTILDEALVCHVAVVVDGTPRVLPTAHVRVSDRIYLHGARANRLLGVLSTGAPASICVTLLDGIVFGRSWFHHSMNFRSAVLYGAGSEVSDPAEKLASLAALVDKAAAGRTREARPPTPEELGATLAVRFPIVEASVKVRSGPPLDGPDLLADECWAGVLPLRLAALPAKDDEKLRAGIEPSLATTERARTFGSGAFAPYERTRGDLVVSTDPGRIDFSRVHSFLAERSFWARGVAAWRQRLATANSTSFGLYRAGDQIGFARVVTDYGRIACLADVFVVEGERGRGFGRWLVQSVLDHPDFVHVDRWVLGTADAHVFYERFGFVAAEPGSQMVRARVA